jgi:opacity protein-like surface antigen
MKARLLVGSLAALTLCAVPSIAAAENTPGSPDNPATTVEIAGKKINDSSLDKPGPYRSKQIALNPLALYAGRISLDLVWLPVVHNAIVVAPHFQSITNEVKTNETTLDQQRFTGFGTEVGYRYYTGERGMDGFFAGPSFIVGAYNAKLPSQDNQSFTKIGLAMDAGAQTFLMDNLTVGAGLGVQYTKVSTDFGSQGLQAGTIAEGGLQPRFLASAGYAF